MKNIETIRSFIGAWSGLDASVLAEYFAEQGSYHNMPAQPVTGRENIKVFIESFIATWTSTEWEILNIVEDGETVYCERLDKTQTRKGNVDLPCFGVFEMEGGKIRVWRDYFDLGTFMKVMG